MFPHMLWLFCSLSKKCSFEHPFPSLYQNEITAAGCIWLGVNNFFFHFFFSYPEPDIQIFTMSERKMFSNVNRFSSWHKNLNAIFSSMKFYDQYRSNLLSLWIIVFPVNFLFSVFRRKYSLSRDSLGFDIEFID